MHGARRIDEGPTPGARADLGPFAVVLDTAGTEFSAYRRLPAPGRMVTIDLDIDNPVPSVSYSIAPTAFGPRRVRFFSANPTPGYSLT